MSSVAFPTTPPQPSALIPTQPLTPRHHLPSFPHQPPQSPTILEAQRARVRSSPQAFRKAKERARSITGGQSPAKIRWSGLGDEKRRGPSLGFSRQRQEAAEEEEEDKENQDDAEWVTKVHTDLLSPLLAFPKRPSTPNTSKKAKAKPYRPRPDIFYSVGFSYEPPAIDLNNLPEETEEKGARRETMERGLKSLRYMEIGISASYLQALPASQAPLQPPADVFSPHSPTGLSEKGPITSDGERLERVRHYLEWLDEYEQGEYRELKTFCEKFIPTLHQIPLGHLTPSSSPDLKPQPSHDEYSQLISLLALLADQCFTRELLRRLCTRQLVLALWKEEENWWIDEIASLENSLGRVALEHGWQLAMEPDEGRRALQILRLQHLHLLTYRPGLLARFNELVSEWEGTTDPSGVSSDMLSEDWLRMGMERVQLRAAACDAWMRWVEEAWEGWLRAAKISGSLLALIRSATNHCEAIMAMDITAVTDTDQTDAVARLSQRLESIRNSIPLSHPQLSEAAPASSPIKSDQEAMLLSSDIIHTRNQQQLQELDDEARSAVHQLQICETALRRLQAASTMVQSLEDGMAVLQGEVQLLLSVGEASRAVQQGWLSMLDDLRLAVDVQEVEGLKERLQEAVKRVEEISKRMSLSLLELKAMSPSNSDAEASYESFRGRIIDGLETAHITGHATNKAVDALTEDLKTLQEAIPIQGAIGYLENVVDEAIASMKRAIEGKIVLPEGLEARIENIKEHRASEVSSKLETLRRRVHGDIVERLLESLAAREGQLNNSIRVVCLLLEAIVRYRQRPTRISSGTDFLDRVISAMSDSANGTSDQISAWDCVLAVLNDDTSNGSIAAGLLGELNLPEGRRSGTRSVPARPSHRTAVVPDLTHSSMAAGEAQNDRSQYQHDHQVKASMHAVSSARRARQASAPGISSPEPPMTSQMSSNSLATLAPSRSASSSFSNETASSQARRAANMRPSSRQGPNPKRNSLVDDVFSSRATSPPLLASQQSRQRSASQMGYSPTSDKVEFGFGASTVASRAMIRSVGRSPRLGCEDGEERVVEKETEVKVDPRLDAAVVRGAKAYKDLEISATSTPLRSTDFIEGAYAFVFGKKRVIRFCRYLIDSDLLMIRVGGGYESLDEFINRTFGSLFHNDSSFVPPDASHAGLLGFESAQAMSISMGGSPATTPDHRRSSSSSGSASIAVRALSESPVLSRAGGNEGSSSPFASRANSASPVNGMNFSITRRDPRPRERTGSHGHSPLAATSSSRRRDPTPERHGVEQRQERKRGTLREVMDRFKKG